MRMGCGQSCAIFLALSVSLASSAFAQSAIERHAWQYPRPLVPLSRTAEAITGPVRVTDRTIVFNGRAVRTVFRGYRWRVWDLFDREKRTAGVYELLGDPGKLRQGNTLCGGTERARFVVLWESYSALSGGAVNMAVWSSATPPENKDSPGLCGTFNYVLNAG